MSVFFTVLSILYAFFSFYYYSSSMRWIQLLSLFQMMKLRHGEALYLS